MNVVTDVAGAYLAPLALTLPGWILYAVNGVYYALQLAVPMLLFVYVLAIEGFRLKTLPLLPFLPFAVMELVVLT
ncbi:MAG: hypothetical protein PHY12_14915, partial [Eubacteriales bacterium]|nr:hypothetical protein [Eubacteriales bacterium]